MIRHAFIYTLLYLLNHTQLHSFIFCYTQPYSTTFCHILLHSTVLNYILPYSAILIYTILIYTHPNFLYSSAILNTIFCYTLFYSSSSTLCHGSNSAPALTHTLPYPFTIQHLATPTYTQSVKCNIAMEVAPTE